MLAGNYTRDLFIKISDDINITTFFHAISPFSRLLQRFLTKIKQLVYEIY